MALALWLAACQQPHPAATSSTVPPFPTPSSSSPEIDGATMGAHIDQDTLTFRVRSRNATWVEVWRYAGATDPQPTEVLALSRRGEIWEGSTGWSAGDAPYYGLRVWGPNWEHDDRWVPGSDAGFHADVDDAGNRFDPNKLLLDPEGREISHDPVGGWSIYTTGADHRDEDSAPTAPKSVVVEDADPPAPGPVRAPQDEVVYEVHVRGFTELDPAVPTELRGTYAGAALRAPALAALGVTAIELQPVHETSNDQNDLTADASGDNYWGYSSLGFFAPDRRYAADQSPGGPTAEFRAMVDAFHAAGIEVFLDVVYNHTAEGGTWGDEAVAPLLSFRGVDNAAYYELDDGRRGYRSDTGVGPNWNAADPVARDLVLDSLHYWSDRLGVDGYRFDLAPILGNACATGCFSFDGGDPDGILARAAAEIGGVLIAEPWGATGEAYQAGHFPAGWSEWNDGFRDTIRADQNELGTVNVTPRQLVDVLTGSPGRYGDDGRKPWSSVAYVVSHDGFTLHDLYHCNVANNDQPWPYGPSSGGTDANLSWDQGGDVVQQRRVARSGMALTLLAAGIPMFTGGDELLRSQQCNNNPYNLDSVATWIDWAALEAESASFQTFTSRMLAFRAAHPALRPADWRGGGQVVVYNPDGNVASDVYLDDPTRHALTLRFDGPTTGDPSRAILVLYNGWSDGVPFALPPTPSGAPWQLVADTNEWLEGDDNALPAGTDAPLPDDSYLLGERSVAVLLDP